ncbi:CD97 antigen-like [Anneissia japonica]|uniref:CD97 antigen-like n=1 Tax=Anneissia japonica TaxID=1529436 RepID=UPI00142574D7|nr:CD97 antigen-like [Anneissia japonica]
MITNVCLGISLLSLLLLLPVYCFFRDLWRSTRIFIHGNLVLNLIATYITFLSGIDSNKNEVCRFVGVTLHFTLLSLFMWMMAEAVFIALKVTKPNSTKRNIPRYYLIICYGVSVVIVVITVAVDIDNYNTTNPCWLNIETGAIYAIVVPALIIIMFNTAILIMTLRTIYIKSRSRLPRSEQKQNESTLKTVKATLFLVPVFGVTWVFGPFAISKESRIFEYLFDILNCLQGLAIFIVYCLLDVEVREQFTKWRARRKRLKDAKSVSSQQRLSMEEKGALVSHKGCSAAKEACNPQIDSTKSLQNRTSSGDGTFNVEINYANKLST